MIRMRWPIPEPLKRTRKKGERRYLNRWSIQQCRTGGWISPKRVATSVCYNTPRPKAHEFHPLWGRLEAARGPLPISLARMNSQSLFLSQRLSATSLSGFFAGSKKGDDGSREENKETVIPPGYLKRGRTAIAPFYLDRITARLGDFYSPCC